ncbi:AMP-dependent synthetase/ligase [Streptomyces sp. NPDC090106]|uniref:AMP-dependent synthetase/ligase n=1 Tax=Streptomyces sp. NPDC090106 TaxID=3365946 RepID=UPI00381063E1
MPTKEQPPRLAPEPLTPASTIPGLLRRNARHHADRPALTLGHGADAVTLSWAQLRAETAALTRGLGALGLKRGDRMLVGMSRRPEHWVTDLAAVHLGVLSSSTCDTWTPGELEAVARHSAAPVLVLEDEREVRRWLPFLDGLPALRAVIVLDPAAALADDPRFVGYAAVRDAVRPDDTAFEALAGSAAPDDPLALLYTPRSTGAPGAVVLTHRNVVHQALAHTEPLTDPDHRRSVAHLSPARAAGRVLGLYEPVCAAGHVTLCPDPDRLLPSLLAARPHTFFAPPPVWDRLAVALETHLESLPREHSAAVAQAGRTILEVFRLRAAGKELPPDVAVPLAQLDATLLRPVRAAVGADDLHLALNAGPPLSTATRERLAGFGLPVREVWHLPETAGPVVVSGPEGFGAGTAGTPLPGVEVEESAEGELLVRGPVVCAGHLRPDGAVEPAVDPQGRLASGWTGTVDTRGTVTVTGRARDLLVVDGTRTVAPAPIEALLRAHPLVGHALAIGDRRAYVTALLVLDPDTAPRWARENGLDADDPAVLAGHPRVLAALDEAVARANAGLPEWGRVRRYHALPGPWTVETGELKAGATPDRRALAERYAAVVDSLYA